MQRAFLDETVVLETLGCFLKYHDDIKRFKEEIWADPGQRAEYLGNQE